MLRVSNGGATVSESLDVAVSSLHQHGHPEDGESVAPKPDQLIAHRGLAITVHRAKPSPPAHPKQHDLP
jgi:hypothetical protein